MFSMKSRLSMKPSLLLLAAIASMGGTLAISPTVLANESEEVTSVSDLINSQDSMGVVTSVTQLSDVYPTDWAFQALSSLVERYGCVAGYPDGTFRGNRAATRYEMAAALNACLDNVSDQFASAEDLDNLRALQTEFQAELATLRGRVDGLEARTAALESSQFSTTTKLKGQALFAAGYVADKDDALDSVLGVDTDADNTSSDRVFLGQRVQLNLQTSFNGKDLLRTRLQSNNVPNLANNGSAGTEQARLGVDDSTPDANIVLDELFYKFKPTDDLTLKVALMGGDYKDDVETYNPYLKSGGNGALSRFFRVNPVVHRAPGDTTLSAVYEINDNIDWAVVFSADDAEDAVVNANGTGGLCCGGEYGVMTQVGVRPTENLRFGLAYARSQYRGSTTDITRGTADAPATGQTLATPLGSSDTSEPFGNVDTTTDNFGLNIDAKISDGFNFSGWAGLTLARSSDATVQANGVQSSEVKLINWAANFVFPDLFVEGNRGAISVGQVPYIFDNGNLNIDDGNDPNFLVEAHYQFKVSKNIKITPGVIAVINANNTSSNDVIVSPLVRTTFKF